jgi:hypothetical protein
MWCDYEQDKALAILHLKPQEDLDNFTRARNPIER